MIFTKHRKTALLALLCASVLNADESVAAHADEASGNKTIVLKEISVKAALNTDETKVLDTYRIASTPASSITDKLAGSSKVQYSQNAKSSAKGGEIAPPKISIRGGRHYENNFMIDGISNNNNINPNGFGTGERNGYSPTVSGESQSFFIDTSLVDAVSFYTENIGAEYGSFTGGVVNAKLKNARMDRWHTMANFRYTKDSWAKYHLTQAQENITYSTTESYQPEFNKYEYNAAFDGPVNKHLGLLVSYGKQRSKIPLWSAYSFYGAGNSTYRERRTQYRENENFLIRLNTSGLEDFEASLTAMYAPYSEGLFHTSSRYSDYDTQSGGFNIFYNMKNSLHFGMAENTLGFKQTKLSRLADNSAYYRWSTVRNGTANWFSDRNSNSYEGGYGDVKQDKRDFSYKGAIEFDEMESGALEHKIKLGLEAEFTKAAYSTKNVPVFFNTQVNSSAVGAKENGILQGEQWMKSKYEYLPKNNKKDYVNEAVFIEDSIKYDILTVRPGLRISSDTLTDNIDIAPRLFINADIGGVFDIYGGYNRYYGTQILSYAIAEYSMEHYERGSWSDDWYFTKRIDYKYDLGDLKTPYSDEFNIGSKINYNDGVFDVGFVKRDYKNQIKAKSQTVNGTTYSEHTNNGKTHYWGLSFGASKEYTLRGTKHFSELSATRSITKTNMFGISGFTSTDGTYSPTHVTYNGELVLAEDMPATQFNSPFVAAYTHLVEFSNDLKMGAVFRYEKGGSGLKQLSAAGKTDSNGLNTRAYELKNYKDTFNVDITASYGLVLKGSKFTLGVEVLNLLNRKNDETSVNAASSFSDEYAMGRQFYANFKYEF
jgi:hypothetical protein